MMKSNPRLPVPCGVLLHQRPMLRDLLRLDNPVALLMFQSWFGTPREELCDRALKEATVILDGKSLIFLKALVDGYPEIINVELDAGQFLTIADLRAAPPIICLHESDDPGSGFRLRDDIATVEFLGIIRSWKLHSHRNLQSNAMPVSVSRKCRTTK